MSGACIKGLSKPLTLYPTTAAGTAVKQHANYGTAFFASFSNF